MATNKRKENEEIVLGNNPIEKYQKPMAIAGTALIVIFILFIGFKYMYLEPRQTEAANEMFKAEGWFAKDSFELALNGNGAQSGFADIVDEYGMTDAANLANYYAGICCLRLAISSDSTKRETYLSDATDYLKNFRSDSKVLGSIGLGACGDAYSDLHDYDEAAKYYHRAAGANDNEYTAPMYLMKEGLTYEELGDYQKAVNSYQRIKDDYSSTEIGRKIDKYLARAQSKL